eukprot:366229-Chlamydomonas_euryale.AAC.60
MPCPPMCRLSSWDAPSVSTRPLPALRAWIARAEAVAAAVAAAAEAVAVARPVRTCTKLLSR